MKLDAEKLDQIEAALYRYEDEGIEFYPSSEKGDTEGYWSIYIDSKSLITYTQYGKWLEEKEEYEKQEPKTREEFLKHLSNGVDFAAEWGYENRQTDWSAFVKQNEIFPLDTISFKLPHPLAQKFKKLISDDKTRLQKYALEAVISAIKDDAESYAYAE